MSAMSINALYQPWRAILSMINMCLTRKTAGYDRPRHPVLQILWGITHRSNIDYPERIWEEFVQSIQTFLTGRKNLATASRRKKKTALLLIPNVRFTKLIIHHLRTKHNIHPRTGSPLHYSHDENVLNTLRFMGKDERGKAKEGGATESSKTTKVTKPKAAKVTKPAGDQAPKKRKLVKETSNDTLPAKRSKAGLVGKRRKAKSPLRLIDELSDEGVLVEEPAPDDEEADIQRALELSLKEQGERTQGPAHPVVLREPVSEKFQPLPEVQGKGKEKVVEEQAAHDLLTLQTPKKKSPTEQFIFQRRPPMPTESSAHAESPSMDAELNLTDSETESDEEASKINAGNQEGQAGPNPSIQDEGQAGPNPGEQDEGQAGPNPGIAAESQLQTSHVVHAGPNLERMTLGTSDASTQQKPEQMDEEFTTTAYLNV
ncbi:retrovirus-related pol polyprotein from transposon TNT 1-94 [Tanacetum coccineum]